MRTKIDTTGIEFEVAATAKPRTESRTSDKQKFTPDGRPVWTVRLDAIDIARETKETIWVEVAGDQPKLTFKGSVVVRDLVYAPWAGRDGKLHRAFRADSIEPASAGSKQSQHAA